MSNDIELPDLPTAFGHIHDANGNQPLSFERGPVPMHRAITCSARNVFSNLCMTEFARSAILADREKRAQAAQGDATLAERHRELYCATYLLLDSVCEDHPAIADVFNLDSHGRVCGALAQLDGHYGVDSPESLAQLATEASKPVQAEAPHVTVRLPGITAKQAAAVSMALCEALVDAGREFGIVLIGEQAEAPTEDSVPRLENCGRYYAQDNTGQWHYINHAGTWQGCPPPFATVQPKAPNDKQIAMAMLAVDDPLAWGKLGAEGGKAMIKQFVSALFATKQAEAPTASNAGERETGNPCEPMDDSDRLKPCPFCGSEAEGCTMPAEQEDVGAGAMFVQCTNSRCMASSALIYPLMDDPKPLLLERWNRRAALAQVPEQVAGDSEDAENYRWLCKHMIVPAPSLWDNGVGFVTPAFPRKSGAMTKPELDAAIRAARTSGEASK